MYRVVSVFYVQWSATIIILLLLELNTSCVHSVICVVVVLKTTPKMKLSVSCVKLRTGKKSILLVLLHV